MEIISLPTIGFASNCFIVHNGKDAFVVDPSISEKKIIKNLQERGLTLIGILLTHGHFDHIWRAQELRDETGAKLYVHEFDDEMLTDSSKNAYRTFTGNDFTIEKADVLLRDGDVIALGDEEIKVIHTPGHTSGCLCLLGDGILVSGDTLFAQSYGRTDFPTGDVPTLAKSLDKLLKLPEETKVYPGHYDSSTIGIEKKYNLMASELMEYYL